MESDELKPELIAVDFAIYGHEVTKQSHVATAVERRGILPFHHRIQRYLHVFIMIVRHLHKNGLPEEALTSSFDQEELDDLDTLKLFDIITEKAGYEFVHVHQLLSNFIIIFCLSLFS